MSKKQDSFYFDNFIACAEYACQAADLLKQILTDFKPEEMEQRLDEIHAIEHAADEKKHQMTDRLAKAFITPIEREDMVVLSNRIDDMTDKIEEVFIRIYMNRITSIRPEAIQMLDIVIGCCKEVANLMGEFADFRHSKKLKEGIIHINTMEEEADSLFISSMRALHAEREDIFQVLAWREIFEFLEKCADACEHVADGVESVVMKNS